MKTKLLFLFLFLTITLQAQTNLVPNGDFENWTYSSQPDNWTKFSGGLVSQNAIAQNGSSSTKMQIKTGIFNFMNSELFPVVAGKTYRVTMYHKLVSGSFADLRVTLYHTPATSKEEIINKSDDTFSSSEWRKIEFDFTPTVSENIEIEIFNSGNGDSEILVDNVSVVDVATLGPQYTLIPDLNFEKKLIELGHDSGAPDGKVLTDKINKLKELEISSNNITELTGIQDFVALEKLSCIKNSLSSLDLRKNLNLMILDCEENSLTNIDVTKNDKLKELHCSYNKLIDLNVSNNKILEKLSCTSNQLSVLDVKNLTSLIELYCDKNQLKNLDLSKNISLTDLDCSNNQLTLLNLKNGKNDILIKEYLLLTNNPNLTCIQVDNKTYSDTNWSSNKDATATFNTDCRPFTLIPDIKFENKLIALGIDNDGVNGKVLTADIDKLTVLDVSNSYILDLSGIQDFVSLKTLNFSNNLLAAIDLSKNIALTEINGESNKITTIDLSKNVALTDFKFRYNLATTLDFSTNVNLVNLSSSSNKLTSINLSMNTALKTVDLSWNQFTNIDLSNNKNIISLYLHYNKLTTVDFSHQTALQSLLISSNLLTNLDLSNNLNLTILNCSFNPLEALDLSKNKILGFLNCSDTKLKSLNFKNGYNKNIFNSSVNFTNNLLLKCIIVDDVLYSNTNWANKKDTMASFSIIDCDLTTSIPDPKFEDKLISLGIDKDGKNGFVYTSSIVTITALDVSNSSIQDLTGIQNFLALKIINCSTNALTSLNLSSNIALTAINCSDNKLSSLNLKNGKNTILINTDINFKNNPSLACIQVDDVVYSNINWLSSKDTNASFNVDCTTYTLVPDSKFEDKLISLGIDKDGKNGKIDIAAVNSITYLDVSNSNIANLTGIQDFVALTYLDCSFNSISNIDVSYNINLTKLDVTENNLKSLDVSKNTKLFNLAFSKNQISSIDLSKNTNLHYVIADRNSLSSLDVSLNAELEIINCGENFLTSLDISKLPKLYHLSCGTNTITALDVSKNLILKELYCNNLSLTVLDVTKNIGLRALNCTNNQLTTLDLSQNKVLDFLYINFNPITTLNLQNGNNYKLIVPPVTGKSNSTGQYSSFLNNKNLSCIQVDDENYSNANWSKIKDTTAKYSNSCSSLSTSDVIFEKLNVYPNPTKGALFIENVSVNNLRIYDGLGKQVNVPFSSNGTSNTANLEQFPKGIYYMYIESEGATTVKKIIVK